MPFLLALCLLAAPPEELQVYRGLKELPAEWAKALPKDFDFGRQMVASGAAPGSAVEVAAPARIERKGGALHLWAPESPIEPRECPPCRGAVDAREELRRLPTVKEVQRAALFVLPRARAKVFLHGRQQPLLLGSGCPPCLAP